jgi:hypothetical protein
MSWRPRPVRGRSLLLVVGGRPRAAGGGAGALPRGLPGAAATWCTLHFGYATTSGGACADRLWTLESAAVTRHLNHCGRHIGVVACWWSSVAASPPLSDSAFRAGLPRRRGRPLGSPYRRRGPWPRQPPATVLWHRWAWPPTRGGRDDDAGRTGPGRRKVGGQVGELTLPEGLVLLQAYPLGLHDRRRLIEQTGCPCGGARHVTYPLPECCAPAPPVRWTGIRR